MRFCEHAIGALTALAVSCGGTSPDPSVGTSQTARARDEKVATAVPLRRLTRQEYNNTVRDLLGDRSRPADSFPPDEAVGGFETNSLAPVTSVLVERYMDAAEALGAAAVHDIPKLAPCPPAHDHTACASAFIDRFGRRAFRRPLEPDERTLLAKTFSEKYQRSDYSGGIRMVIEVILQSPQFLYRIEVADPVGSETRALTDYEVATRLSFLLWSTTPDDSLLDAAERGKLRTTEDIEAVTRRMLKDPRAAEGIRTFHHQWLGLRELETISRDGVGSSFTPELKAAMIEETMLFATSTVQGKGDAIKALLTSNNTFVNSALAKHYGVPAPVGAGFTKVSLPAHQRSGVLTQASVMTVHAGAGQTAPILRGKFVREKLLCQSIPPPPANAMLAPPKVDAKLTTKQRFEQHRTDAACAGCHQMMDPLGFAFEHYDAIGIWRTQDGAFPVDATGDLSLTDDADGSFNGAVELATRLAGSTQVKRCMTSQWFRFALGRSDGVEDSASLEIAYRAFERSGFELPELLVAITTSHPFRHTQPTQKGSL